MNENNFAAKRHQWAMLRSRRSFKLPFAKKTIFYLFCSLHSGNFELLRFFFRVYAIALRT
jgi:hypothetical protein